MKHSVSYLTVSENDLEEFGISFCIYGRTMYEYEAMSRFLCSASYFIFLVIFFFFSLISENETFSFYLAVSEDDLEEFGIPFCNMVEQRMNMKPCLTIRDKLPGTAKFETIAETIETRYKHGNMEWNIMETQTHTHTPTHTHHHTHTHTHTPTHTHTHNTHTPSHIHTHIHM